MTNDNSTPTPDETPEPTPAPTPDPNPAPAPELTGDALRISQIESEVTALDAQIAAAETGRQRKELTAKRNALTQERSLLQLKPVLDAGAKADAEPSQPADTIAPVEAISEKYQGAADAYLTDVQSIAKDMGMPAGEMEPLFHFIAGRAVEDIERDAHAGLAPGQVPGPDLSNRQACETYLHRRYGTSASAVIAAAQAAFGKLPKDVQAWLDHDPGTGERLTNSPSVIAGLAFFGGGYTKLSKEAAAKELKTIRESKAFQAGDKLSVDKATLLLLIVNRGAAKQDTASLNAPTQKPAPVPGRAKLEAEARTIRMDPGYIDRGRANHKQLVARMSQIMAELYPENS